MKKMKRITVIVLSLIMAIAMLGGCTSTTGNTGNQKPTEEPTSKPTEITDAPVVTEEPTEAPTEEPTVTAEPVPENDVIVDLFDSSTNPKTVNPELLLDWDNFIVSYTLANADSEYLDMALWKIRDVNVDFTIGTTAGSGVNETYSLNLFFSKDNENNLRVWYVIDGEYYERPGFVPMFYNQTQGCFAGYDTRYEGGTTFVEIRYNPTLGGIGATPVDPSTYGL